MAVVARRNPIVSPMLRLLIERAVYPLPVLGAREQQRGAVGGFEGRVIELKRSAVGMAVGWGGVGGGGGEKVG